jgi:hypothetical protein
MISVNQLDFQAHGNGESQCQKILNHLRAHLGEWVPMPELYQVSGAMAVHSRIADLRAAGCRIEHKNEREPGSRTQKSFYRLMLSEPQPQPQPV